MTLDIKEYCKRIGHNFNLLESAYLIYKSVSHTLPEKHAAWKELIEIMPDVVVGEEIFRSYYDINYRFFRPVEPELEDTEYPHYDSLLDRFFRKGSKKKFFQMVRLIRLILGMKYVIIIRKLLGLL